jgi:neutral ceramidase
MVFKRILRYLGLTIVGVISFLVIFILVSVAPVDRTPVSELPAYEVMMDRMDALEIEIPESRHGFSVGYGKANMTPSQPVATAGYGKRRGQPYRNVHDSVYVRSLVIDNGSERVAIVSADLLIIPPTVTEILEEKLQAIGFSLDNTYLGATHSHNSIGHWGGGATRFIYGAYEDSVVHFIADRIVNSISQAAGNLFPSTLKHGAFPVPQAVKNRLIDGGNEDPYLRVIEIHRQDSSKLVMLSYAAHATCLSQSTIELSRDYPGMVVDALESNEYDFAIFLAGSVGSHTGAAPMNDWGCMAWMAGEITNAFIANRDSLREMKGSTLVMETVPLALGDPQVKISGDWKLRAWLFRSAFGEYDAFLSVLRVGDVVMLGTPCDFSGEFNESLDSLARSRGLRAMVTSFNGGYIGYITPGTYYDIDHYETRLMNWYAPGTGDYVRDCLAKLMIEVSDTR